MASRYRCWRKPDTELYPGEHEDNSCFLFPPVAFDKDSGLPCYLLILWDRKAETQTAVTEATEPFLYM